MAGGRAGGGEHDGLGNGTPGFELAHEGAYERNTFHVLALQPLGEVADGLEHSPADRTRLVR